jgi:hypothetical protein
MLVTAWPLRVHRIDALHRAPTDRLEVNLHDWQMLDFARKRGGLSDEDKKLTDAQLLAKLQNDGGELLHQMQRRNELMKKVQHRRSTAIRLDSRLNSESQLDEQPAPRSRPRSNAVVPVSADGRLVVQQKTGGGAMVSFIRGLSMRRGGGQLGTVKDDDGDYDGEFNDLPDKPEEECHGTSGLDKEGLTHDLVIPMSGGDLDGAEVHLTATLLPITREWHLSGGGKSQETSRMPAWPQLVVWDPWPCGTTMLQQTECMLMPVLASGDCA